MSVDGLASYQEYKILKRDLITPSMRVINKLSNINVEMESRLLYTLASPVSSIIGQSGILGRWSVRPSGGLQPSRFETRSSGFSFCFPLVVSRWPEGR